MVSVDLTFDVCKIDRSLSGGTLRWQSPELMGGLSTLTPAIDVYAYAISYIEILGMGEMPWPLMDDDAVRFFVLSEYSRYISKPLR